MKRTRRRALIRTMWMDPRFGSAVRCGETGAAPGAQPGADPVSGGGELTGVDGLLL